MTPVPQPKSMVVAGVMSGTSADGIDVALVRIASGLSGSTTPRIKLLGHRTFPYPKAVRLAVLAAMHASSISVAELARLDWRLGELYADAIARTCTDLAAKPALIGLHGQTIYHQATAAPYLGRPTRATWQLGEAAVIAARLRVPVVSDFRPADLAASGQAAPLVPMLDLTLYASRTTNRILLNLGGIANLTAIPAGSTPDRILAFDTGPANMLVDALMTIHHGKPFDRNGRVAAKGRVHELILKQGLQHAFFSAAPPKSCGREEFGTTYAQHFNQLCGQAAVPDIIATATELTAASILLAYTRFVQPHFAHAARRTELIVAGGGVRNTWLMARLTDTFSTAGVTVKTADQTGMPAEAKEAVAFALLAWLRWHGLPGNIPAATGAHRDAILGAVSLW